MPPNNLPTRQQILDFLADSDRPAGKREIARAFGIKGQDKIALKALLKQMAEDGVLDQSPGRNFHQGGGLPRVTVFKVVSTKDGEVWASPEHWEAEGPVPKVRVIERGRRSALGDGDRFLGRTEERGKGHVAHVMKKLRAAQELVLGVVRSEGDRHWLTPVDKKERRELQIHELGEAQSGDLVLAERSGKGAKTGARVDAILGDPFAPRSFSLIAIHKHGLPDEFPDEVIAEAKKVAKLPLGDNREDLTHLPIVAIDPEDARDHDDAIWAKARDDGDGWDAIVAIADVSLYVRPGSALDKSARKRGNSVYFPDRVVPMLPHELSSDICSLKQDEKRAAMACHLHVGKDGKLRSWRFSRAVIQVAGNLPYEQAQAAMDGKTTELDPELIETALKPLWECWKALLADRNAREPLELDLPERRVVLDEKGRIMSVAPRERLDAHRLVEDFMIAANVAAAKALEKKKAPVMYRVHEVPSREKLVALKDFLGTLDLEFALGQVIRPKTFNRVIERIGKEHESRTEIMEQLLRTQMQARYSPEPLGHFGLALASYAHFTSPIRRYADLLVHRALVSAYGLGEGGLPKGEGEEFERIGEHISQLERRAMEAERETVDRYVAAFLADQVGQILDCRITGVQPFGFFATVEELGGDGLVRAATLGTEYFRYDEAAQALIGERSGDVYRMGQRLKLKLAEANPASGALRFELPEGAYGGPPPRHSRKTRGKPGKGRPPKGKAKRRRNK